MHEFIARVAGRDGQSVDEQPTAEADGADEGSAGSSTGGPDATRRRLLASGGAVAAAGLAGCSSVVPDGVLGGGATNESDDPSGNETDTPTTATEAPKEVDVVGLMWEERDSKYEFQVTVDHPGGDGGADWWQVEGLDGTKIHRETFEPRQNERFSTTTTVALNGTSKVVVRGHGTIYGYGGQVVVADVENGHLEAEPQPNEPKSFAGYTF